MTPQEHHPLVPADFLIKAPADAAPVTVQRIDFANSPLPEYSDKFAYTIDNILSPSECKTLLRLAATQAPCDPANQSPWRPATVGHGAAEYYDPEYRHSDRLLWDHQEIVDRLVSRVFGVEDGKIGQALRERHRQSRPFYVNGQWNHHREVWSFTRGNDRMRFLRYGAGMFFAPHCDANFRVADDDDEDEYEQTFFTLHFYLNDEGVRGGETAFVEELEHYTDESPATRRIDVAAQRGRVLVFEQDDVWHSGREVTAGVKYTMRTELFYRRTGAQFTPITTDSAS